MMKREGITTHIGVVLQICTWNKYVLEIWQSYM